MKRAARSVAAVLVLAVVMVAGTSVQTQREAHAVVPLLGAAAAAALPFSVVSAGVGGGLSVVSTGGALAGAAITAGAAFAGNWAVNALFSWSASASPTLGEPPPATDPMEAYKHPGITIVQSVQTMPDSPICPGTGYGCVGMGFQRTSGYSPALSTATYSYTWYRADGTTISTSGTGFPSGTGTQWPTCYSAIPCRWTSPETFVMPAGLLITQSGVDLYVWGSVPGKAAATPPAGSGQTVLSVTPTTKCVDLGGLVQTFAGTIVKTTRSTSDPQLLSFPACPAGTTVQSRSAPITRDSDGAVQGDAVTGATGSSPGVWSPPAVPAAYPDCSGGVCVMTLTRTMPDGSTVTCSAVGVCTSYADVVKQWPQVGTGASSVARQAPDGSSYQCRFGAYPVAVAECQVIPGAGIAGAPAEQEQDTRCDWHVTKPWTWPATAIRCAFVPSEAAVTASSTKVDAAWANTGLTEWTTAVSGSATALGQVDDQAAGCEGPVFSIVLGGKAYRFAPLDACGQPMQGVAVVIKVLIGFYVIVKGSRFVARPVLSAFGMGQAV